MSSIDWLQKAIAQALSVSLQPPEIPKVLTQQLKELQQALSGAGAGQPPRAHASSDFRVTAVGASRAHVFVEVLGLLHEVCLLPSWRSL